MDNFNYKIAFEAEKKFLKELKAFLSEPSDAKELKKAYSNLNDFQVENENLTDSLIWTFCLLVDSLDNSVTAKTSAPLADLLENFTDIFLDEECLIKPTKNYIEKNILKRSEIKMFLSNFYKKINHH